MERKATSAFFQAFFIGILFGGIVAFFTYLLYPTLRGLPEEGRTYLMVQTHRAVTLSAGAMAALLGMFLAHGYLIKKYRAERFTYGE